MVVRLIARWWASLTRVKAKSIRLQRVAGRSCSSVLLVASVTTEVRSSGGKVPGPVGTRGVLQSGQAGGDEVCSRQSATVCRLQSSSAAMCWVVGLSSRAARRRRHRKESAWGVERAWTSV